MTKVGQPNGVLLLVYVTDCVLYLNFYFIYFQVRLGWLNKIVGD